jgi:hypothetical protein
MAKYRKDKNRVLAKDTTLVVPHGGNEKEESITITRVQFSKGDTLVFIKSEMTKVLTALGLDRTARKLYVKLAFNDYKDL